MNDQEFGQWMIQDTVKDLAGALAIYAVPLALYWIFIG